jgi:hypothetical protein
MLVQHPRTQHYCSSALQHDWSDRLIRLSDQCRTARVKEHQHKERPKVCVVRVHLSGGHTISVTGLTHCDN